jgi:uncharacterized protein YecE (DUF72 family)
MSPLANRIGQYWLQLPATFGPRDLPALWQFLDACPGNLPTAWKSGILNFLPKVKQKKRSIAAC